MLLAHRVHDYKFLLRRWRAVARASGLRMKSFTEMSGYPIFYLESRHSSPETQWIYLSAGIHGDEPAATEALVSWAETRVTQLKGAPFLLFPCLNPWGLINNRRSDESGLDLNRSFHRDDLPLAREWKRIIAGRKMRLSMALHEDYDAQGLYLYELRGPEPFWGETLVEAARPFIPPDARLRIEGRGATEGVIRRRPNAKFFAKVGMPESGHLHKRHSARTFTIESPSEFALDARVNAHLAILDEAMRLSL